MRMLMPSSSESSHQSRDPEATPRGKHFVVVPNPPEGPIYVPSHQQDGRGRSLPQLTVAPLPSPSSLASFLGRADQVHVAVGFIR